MTATRSPKVHSLDLHDGPCPTAPQFRALIAIPSNLLAALSRRIFRALSLSLDAISDAIKIFFAERHFASGARCTPREAARGRGFLARVLPNTSRSLLVLARVKNSALLSLSLADERDVVAWRLEGRWSYLENSPLEGPPFRSCLSFSLSFFAFVPHPPPRRFLFPSLLFSLSLSLLYLSLSSTFSFARLAHSYTAVPQARQRRDQATRKDHLVLYILAPAAMILSTAFKNIRRPC